MSCVLLVAGQVNCTLGTEVTSEVRGDSRRELNPRSLPATGRCS